MKCETLKLACSALILIFLFCKVSALQISLQHYQPAEHKFVGKFALNHSKLLHNHTLAILIDGNVTATVDLNDYLPNITSYEFKDIGFVFRIFANGTNKWIEFPNVSFKYRIIANGTNGTQRDYWEERSQVLEANVSAVDGLKFIRDGSKIIFPPNNNNGDTEWYVEIVEGENVTLVAREACGNEIYQRLGLKTSKDGWIRRTLLCKSSDCDSNLCTGAYCADNWIKSGTAVYNYIEPFDNTSFTVNRYLFCDNSIGDCGGIYKNGNYQTWDEVKWNGSVGHIKQGYVRIENYDDQAEYKIVYFPPNGPRICAWTNYNRTVEWHWNTSGTKTYSGTTNFKSPYIAVIDYSLQDFPQPPDCPPQPSLCLERSVEEYYAKLETDGKLNIESRFDKKSQKLYVNVTTNSTELAHNYTFELDLSKLPVRVPKSLGEHNLTVMIMKDRQILWQASANFTVCKDFDKDGFCKETGDCDETNDRINPSAEELCNGIDDDCDGQIDEDFWKAGTKLGQPCSVGACKGYYVCTPDGRGVVCSGAEPTPEICGDGIDNDCDGVVDEEMDWIGGKAVPGCFCKPGDTKPCGSNIGRCRQGYMICINYSWSECIDAVGPVDEVCNGIDDNCDGIIDNVGKDFGVSSSVKESRCRCYGGGQPSDEVCNNIDDDCDGEIDEGLNCCKPGETRPCSEAGYLGECAKGVQNCTDGTWGECSIKPQDEICYDGLDNDCDGQVDENCDPSITCMNGIKDLNEDGIDCGGPCRPCMLGEMPGTWIAVALIGVIIVLVIGALGFKGVI